MTKSLLCYMHHTSQSCCIQVWEPGNHKWVEFRGDPYHQWNDEPNDAQEFHDALEGWHTSVLHSGDVLMIHDGHPDFKAAFELYERNK